MKIQQSLTGNNTKKLVPGLRNGYVYAEMYIEITAASS